MDGEVYISDLIRLASVFHMLRENNNLGVFQPIIGPWYESLQDTEKYQRLVLMDLAKEYAKTGYGQSHRASEVQCVADRSIDRRKSYNPSGGQKEP